MSQEQPIVTIQLDKIIKIEGCKIINDPKNLSQIKIILPKKDLARIKELMKSPHIKEEDKERYGIDAKLPPLSQPKPDPESDSDSSEDESLPYVSNDDDSE